MKEVINLAVTQQNVINSKSFLSRKEA